MASATTHLTANSEAELSAAIAAHAGKADVFVLFCGAVSPDTGASWCSDCVEADPTIHAAFDKATAPTVLISVPLVRSEYKGNSEHWARTMAGVKLQRIPSLMKWGKGKAIATLVEDECKQAALVDDLVLGE
jgi:thiol-disulfide isomerase/thioredoxin